LIDGNSATEARAHRTKALNTDFLTLLAIAYPAWNA
jgi:hypothetical protein